MCSGLHKTIPYVSEIGRELMRQNLVVAVLLGVNVAISPVALADDPTGGYFDGIEVQCPGTPGGSHVTSTESQCYQEAFQKSDRELNEIYQQLMNKADSQEKEYLRDMQLAWINLKESQCSLTRYYYRHARLNDRFKFFCEAAMTIRRVQELKALGTGISW